ncbi:MAG: type I DNA topoisomerase [Bacteroidales bacterium]|jgi:DNA topoisomerase-1|nr:type I DNA topoisomerase [Bacteroidales bacterium]
MNKDLIIVESPAKAKTIQKFIGKEYDVISCKGHVRDLPEHDLGIDIEKQFTPQYVVLGDKKKLINDIKSLSREVDTVWLATDDDREGEAISWHLMDAAQLDENKVKRIVFHEITQKAIEQALQHPRGINHELVNAQQARRVLDRLVGFELSPVLWRKVKPQLSAGRVQSVAVKLIVEREQEIQRFNGTSAFRVTGNFVSTNNPLTALEAELSKRHEHKEEAIDFLQHCQNVKNFAISAIEKQPGKKSPAPPFTTSTLQQEASRKLGFSVSRTMTVAQQLYEAGYITYMRTDSVNLSEFALINAKEQVETLYGKDYYKRRQYVTKSKGAQEAHEAIRPTNLSHHTISGDSSAQRLYELIWKRTIASQMSDARTEKTVVTIPVPQREEKFLCTGEVILFQGFLKVYIESTDEDSEEIKGLLPPLAQGEILTYTHIAAMQKFAQPAPRYTEASLVKKMEELGIGRPSTYAPTISTIQKREYVSRETRQGKERDCIQIILAHGEITENVKKEKYGYEKDKLFPTDIGRIVNDYLQENFDDIMDYGFTAEVEKEFDDIAEGALQWQTMLERFYGRFHKEIERALTHSTKASGERLLGIDPASGKNVYVRLGRYGSMVQIGENTETEKARYARVPAGKTLDTITLKEALDQFLLPREAGTREGEPMTVALSRFGPYIKFRDLFISIPKGEDPLTISPERCSELIDLKIKYNQDRQPRILGMHEGKEVQALVGRYGPYLKFGDANVKLPKGTDISSLTLETALQMMSSRAEKSSLVTFAEDPTLKVLNGRYGPYLTNGKENFKIPKTSVPEQITYTEALEIMKNTPASKKKTSIRRGKK